MAAAFIDFQRFCGSRALAWLLTVNVGLFLILWVAILIGDALGMSGNFTMQWMCVPSQPSLILLRPWTMLTYMVTQYDFLHLLFNMLWLFWFGRMLLTTLSDRHLLWLYIGGGLLGAIFYAAANALWPIAAGSSYLCGSSASVLAVMTASALRTPDLRVSLFLFGEVKLKWVAIACIALTFVGVGGGNAGGQAAHVAGVVFAIAFVMAVRKGFDPASKFQASLSRRSASPSSAAISAHAAPQAASRPRRNVKRDGNAVAKAAAGRLNDAERLDLLLDKIRISGYASLTTTEKKELNALSQRIKE